MTQKFHNAHLGRCFHRSIDWLLQNCSSHFGTCNAAHDACDDKDTNFRFCLKRVLQCLGICKNSSPCWATKEQLLASPSWQWANLHPGSVHLQLNWQTLPQWYSGLVRFSWKCLGRLHKQSVLCSFLPLYSAFSLAYLCPITWNAGCPTPLLLQWSPWFPSIPLRNKHRFSQTQVVVPQADLLASEELQWYEAWWKKLVLKWQIFVQLATGEKVPLAKWHDSLLLPVHRTQCFGLWGCWWQSEDLMFSYIYSTYPVVNFLLMVYLYNPATTTSRF